MPKTTIIESKKKGCDEKDPISLHLDQTIPQTFTGGVLTGTGVLKVTDGLLGLGTEGGGGSSKIWIYFNGL